MSYNGKEYRYSLQMRMLLQMQIIPLKNWSTLDFVLPDGWKIEEKRRRGGVYPGMVDKVFFCSQIVALVPLFFVTRSLLSDCNCISCVVINTSLICLGVCTGMLFFTLNNRWMRTYLQILALVKADDSFLFEAIISCVHSLTYFKIDNVV